MGWILTGANPDAERTLAVIAGEDLAVMFEGGSASGAERAYRRAAQTSCLKSCCLRFDEAMLPQADAIRGTI